MLCTQTENEALNLPTLLGNSRHHKKVQDCKRPVPDAEDVLCEYDMSPKIPENVFKVLSALPCTRKQLLPAKPCTGPTKRPQPAQMQFKPDARSVKVQGVAAFRLLGENKKIEDYFEFGEEIYVDAKGTGKVLNAKRKVGKKGESQECVVKVRPKKVNSEEESAWRTSMTRLLTSKCFPNVLEIQEIFEDEQVYYIVMAKCSGGELFDFLAHEYDVPLSQCKRIIREILFSLKDLHGIGLIHRDVKPENLMFDEPAKTLKLIDFDSCVPWNPNSPTSKPHLFHGTQGYIAPEVLVDRASPKSDLFAVGVILFLLITGEMPWSAEARTLKDPQVDGPNAKVVYEALRNERIDWHESIWLEFPCAADLCKQLLAFDPSDRIASASEALNHPWLQTKMH